MYRNFTFYQQNHSLLVKSKYWFYDHLRLWIVKRFFSNLINTSFVRVLRMERIPANANPFHHDFYHMGTDLVRGWMILHEGPDPRDQPMELKYIILINIRTGKRFKVILPQE